MWNKCIADNPREATEKYMKQELAAYEAAMDLEYDSAIIVVCKAIYRSGSNTTSKGFGISLFTVEEITTNETIAK